MLMYHRRRSRLHRPKQQRTAIPSIPHTPLFFASNRALPSCSSSNSKSRTGQMRAMRHAVRHRKRRMHLCLGSILAFCPLLVPPVLLSKAIIWRRPRKASGTAQSGIHILSQSHETDPVLSSHISSTVGYWRLEWPPLVSSLQ